MSLSLIRKPFVMQGLAITVAALMMNSTHAASEQEQIQQLRDEVKELKALLQQYVPQAKQQNDATQVAVAPATPVVATQNQNTSVVTAAPSKKSPLTFSTASGAEVKLYGFLRMRDKLMRSSLYVVYISTFPTALELDKFKLSVNRKFLLTPTSKESLINFKKGVLCINFGYCVYFLFKEFSSFSRE